MSSGDNDRVELSVSDFGQIGSLQEWLSSVPGVQVQRIAGPASPGELGTLDVLTVLAGSGGLVAAIRVIPEFLRSRRSSLSITATINGQKFSVTANNVKDVMPILERALNER